MININIFSSIYQLSISNINDSNNIISNHPPSMDQLSCEYCNITSLPNTTLGFGYLSLNNNPISQTLYLSNLNSSKHLYLINTDPIFKDHRVTIVNDLVEPFTNVDLQIPVEQDIFNSNFLNLKSITSKNINFNKATEPHSLINAHNLAEIAIINSPNFSNGSSPFINFPASISLIILENIFLRTNPNDLFPESIYYYSVRNNKIETPLPILSTQSPSIEIDLSYNEYNGIVTRDYCRHNIDFSYNNLTGDVPSCYTCYFNNQLLRNRFLGNNFNNVNDNSSALSPCTTIKVLEYSKVLMGSDLIIKGYDFPRDLNQITSTPALAWSVTKVSEEIRAKLDTVSVYNEMVQNGYIMIYISNSNSQPTAFKIPIVVDNPFVNKIYTYPESNGYLFKFVGGGFGNKVNNITVKFGSTYTCVVQSGLTFNEFGCMIYFIDITEQLYQINITVNNLFVTVPYSFVRNYPIVSSLYPALSNQVNGSVILYGFFGYNLSNPVVTIGDQNCEIQKIFSTNLTCILEQPTSGLKNLTLQIGGLYFYGSYINKEETIPCLNPCKNGVCTSYGVCSCYQGFGGPQCESTVSSGGILVNENSTTISRDNINFEISIVSLQEINYKGEVFKVIPLKGWKLTSKPDKNTWIYGIKLNEESTISYQIYQAPESMDITFASVPIHLEKDSIKLSVHIINYTFQSSLNTLELVMSTTVSSVSECNGNANINGEESQLETLNYFTIEQEGKVLYGKFIDQMMSDGKPTYSSTKIMSKTENEIIVAISIPHCTECIIDPNLSVLLDPNHKESDCSTVNSKDKKWLIPTVVVVTVVGGLSILGAVGYLLQKRYYYKIKMVKQKVLESFSS
ncbi:tenascin C [Tieghemostelium lacteum]|uniref:Tenascin C n=1 Tax=Tieghemostelium lacteum TaxID=361077 RepID=A0A152A2V8_TIELA|nr:tenascin C [Tieghemostelium lacteum]|eukprot:KYR00593.1 tenascin C [Tieghemostelium lacteum]